LGKRRSFLKILRCFRRFYLKRAAERKRDPIRPAEESLSMALVAIIFRFFSGLFVGALDFGRLGK
jgi:hypothetical protein